MDQHPISGSHEPIQVPSPKYKVTVADGFDYHFKVVLRKFDENAKIVQETDTRFVVETKVSEEELRKFSMVKKVDK